MADFPGPLSPEQLAAVQGYYGVPGVNMSEAPLGPPPPPPAAPPPFDAGPYYNYAPASEPAPTQPTAPIRPVGAQLSQAGNPQVAPFSGTGAPPPAAIQPPPVAPAAPPGPPIINEVSAPASAKDDREFAALRHLQDTRKPGAGGHGGGGAANPDPFGVKAAQGKFLGTFDAEEAAIRSGATAEGDRAALIGERRAELARQQQEDAAIHAAELEQAQKGFDAHMSEVQRQVDEVREQKIDPGRLMRGDSLGFMAVLGGVMGGIYMGLNKLDHNPFLDDLNKQIDRDIAAQEKDLDNRRAGVANSMNVLREQRATFKDNDLAKLQTRSLMYAATEEAIKAEAAKYDQPMTQARADQAISTVERARTQNDLAVKTAAQQHAAAMAAAGAAQIRAQQKEMRTAFGDTYEKNIAAGMSPAIAEAEATRMVQNLFAGGAAERPAAGSGAATDPIGAVPKDQRAAATKELEEHSKAEAGIKNIKKSFAHWRTTGVDSPRQIDAVQASIAGAYKAGLGPGMSSDNDYEAFIKPNIPKVGDSAETLERKKNNIVQSMRSKVATPTLDRHAAGWKGPEPVQKFNMDGTPKEE
jgi:hypothetical protein